MDQDVQELKRRVSPKLLQTRGVSGVGIREGVLTVYLTEDSDDVRRDAAATVEQEQPGAQVNFVVTGPFRVQA
jgi:hypothetical protein